MTNALYADMNRSTTALSTKKSRKMSPSRRGVRNTFVNSQLQGHTGNMAGNNNGGNVNSNCSKLLGDGVPVTNAITGNNGDKANSGDRVFSPSFKHEYQKLQQIGSGTYGDIWKVQRKTDHKIFVLKNVTLVNLTQQQIKLSMGEVEAMKKICHPNIIKFYESCMEGRSINIIMEHAPYGDLSCMIEQARSRGCYLNEKSLWEYLIQISEGLEYLHKEKILHRDIKAQNIFLDENLNIKIGDFGLVRMLGTHSVAAHSQVGTPLYFSPELCKEESYDEKSDVWSFGCLMYEMAALHLPFEAKNTPALIAKIVNVQPKHLPDIFSNELKFVILKMLEKNPVKRPSVAQILAYEPVQVRLPHSVFRREKENFRKQKKNFLQDFKIGQDAVNRIPKLERDMKAIKEEYERQIVSLNIKVEKVKEEKVELSGRLEEKEILVKKQNAKIQHIYKENRSLKERVKNLEENNRLRAANEKKIKALYIETKRKLEEEVRFYQRQRSRPPTPQRRSGSNGNASSGSSISGSGSLANSNTNSATPSSVSRKQSTSRQAIGEYEISPSQSPNPSPIPFSSKMYSPRSTRINVCTPPPSTYIHQAINGNNSAGSSKGNGSKKSSKSFEDSPASSVSSSSSSKKEDKVVIMEPSAATPYTGQVAAVKSLPVGGGGEFALLKRKSKSKICEVSKQIRSQKRDADGKNSNCSSLSKNMDDFIDNLNINNISREMQCTLEDEGDFEPNDLDDDTSTNLSTAAASCRDSSTLGVLGGTNNVCPKSDESMDNSGIAKATSGMDVFNSEEMSQPFTSPNATQYLTMCNATSNDSGPNIVGSDRDRRSTLRSFPPRLIRLEKKSNNPSSSFETDASSYSNSRVENPDMQYQPDLDVVKKYIHDSPDRFNVGVSAHLPKRVTGRGLNTPSPQIVAPPSISRLSIDAMEENNAEVLELHSDEIFVEKETIKSSIIANDFTRDIRKLRSTSSVQSAASGSTVSSKSNSPPLSSSCCNFVSRSFYSRSTFSPDLFNESPTLERVTDSKINPVVSPLLPKNFGDFSDYNVTNDASTSSVSHPVHQKSGSCAALFADMPSALPSEVMEHQSEKYGNEFSNTPMPKNENDKAPTPSQVINEKEQCPSFPRYTGSTKSGLLSFQPSFFGLHNTGDKDIRFSGLFRWDRVRRGANSKSKANQSRGLASGKVWRNGATFRLQKSIKQLLIVFKARKSISRIKSLKVRCKKDGECDFKKIEVSSPVRFSPVSGISDIWYMMDSKRVEFTGFAGSSQRKRYKQISEIMLDFHQDCLNLVENVIVLDFDHRFKDMAANSASRLSSKVRENSVNEEWREEDTILQKAHNRDDRQKKIQRTKHQSDVQDVCTKAALKSHFNASEIAKLKARVQQLGYNVKTK